MRISKFKNEIEQLKKEVMGETLSVKLESGETVNLRGDDDLLHLLVEGINYSAGIIEDDDLSKEAKQIRKAVPSQSRYIDTVRGLFRSGG